MSEKILTGIPMSYGVGIGPVFAFDESVPLDMPAYRVDAHEVPQEIARLDQAIAVVREELARIREHAEKTVGPRDARILLVHLQLLEDPLLQQQIQEEIRREGINAETAVSTVIHRYGEAFERLEDPVARDRATDLRDVGRRIIRGLRPTEPPATSHPPDEPFVLVTRELFPSDAAHLDRRRLAGIVTEVGGAASHAAILARDLAIPAVAGVREWKMLTACVGDVVVVDGGEGRVVLNPSDDTLAKSRERANRLQRMRETLQAEPSLPAVTRDGVEVDLLINVENTAEVMPEDLGGLKGIGLYRTEFIYMNREMFPSEDEQLATYRSVCERAGRREVVFRTIDIGGDKRLPYFRVADEDNPALGWRGFRVSDEWPDLFIAQVRALLRASVHGQVRIMLPMITTVEEVRRARAIVEDVRADLKRRNVPSADKVPFGIMIEVPAAVLAIDALLKEVDFVSIGSNDLIQYILAVDRNNARVAKLSEPLNPSVLRAIQMVLRAGESARKPVSLCGEMAGSVFHTLVLLGMGLRRFSVARHYVTGVGRLIRAVTLEEARQTARQALAYATTSEVKAFLHARTREKFREMGVPILEADG